MIMQHTYLVTSKNETSKTNLNLFLILLVKSMCHSIRVHGK